MLKWRKTATAALAGDRDALQRLAALAQSFLQASQAYNGSTAAYAADFDRIMDVLDRARLAAGARGGPGRGPRHPDGAAAQAPGGAGPARGTRRSVAARAARCPLRDRRRSEGPKRGRRRAAPAMAGVSAGESTLAEQVAAGNARVASLLEEYLQLQEQERQERLRKQAEDAARAARQRRSTPRPPPRAAGRRSFPRGSPPYAPQVPR
jgi:hypothetical protein